MDVCEYLSDLFLSSDGVVEGNLFDEHLGSIRTMNQSAGDVKCVLGRTMSLKIKKSL